MCFWLQFGAIFRTDGSLGGRLDVPDVLVPAEWRNMSSRRQPRQPATRARLTQQSTIRLSKEQRFVTASMWKLENGPKSVPDELSEFS